LKLLRILRFPIILSLVLTAISILTTTPLPALEYWVVKTFGIEPYWNSEDLEMFRWNRLVKKYGVRGAERKFERREFE
jgi:hypothetical protein